MSFSCTTNLPTVILASKSQPEGPCESRQVAALVPVKQGDGSCWCQSSPLCRLCVCACALGASECAGDKL